MRADLRGGLSSQSLGSEFWLGVQIPVLHAAQCTKVQPEEIVKQRGPDVLVGTATYVRYRQHNCRYCRWLHSLTGPYILYLSVWVLARPLAAGCTGFLSILPQGTMIPRCRDRFEAQQITHASPHWIVSSLKLATLEESEPWTSVPGVADIWRQVPVVSNANPARVRG